MVHLATSDTFRRPLQQRLDLRTAMQALAIWCHDWYGSRRTRLQL